MIRFTVPGPITTKGSGRAYTVRRRDGRIGVRVTNDNPRARTAQRAIGFAAREALARSGRAWFEGPVRVKVDVFLARPRRVTHAYPITRPDVDKVARVVLDALAGVLYRDDSLVCGLAMWKRYSVCGTPYLCVEVDEAS